jgi:hypothetical protein
MKIAFRSSNSETGSRRKPWREWRASGSVMGNPPCSFAVSIFNIVNQTIELMRSLVSGNMKLGQLPIQGSAVAPRRYSL